MTTPAKTLFRSILFLALAGIALLQPCQAQPVTPALVELKARCPEIDIDLRYATPDNFTGRTVYPVNRAFLAAPAAEALARVQEDLGREGFRLRVWDAYRPLAVQWEFWRICSDSRFVADPRQGSRHNRGASVDVTLLDSSGKEMLMPTAFDDFSAQAGAFYRDAPLEARKNRQILQRAMTRHGFRILASEWWHFDFEGWKAFPLLDVPIADLKPSEPTF